MQKERTMVVNGIDTQKSDAVDRPAATRSHRYFSKVEPPEDLIRQHLPDFAARFLSLTPIELRICILVTHDFKNWEIANVLGVTEHNIENHRSRIRKKFGIGKSVHLQTYLLSLHDRRAESVSHEQAGRNEEDFGSLLFQKRA